MNRVIKFRAWDTVDKEMVGWDSITSHMAILSSVLVNPNGNYIPLQFTGLHDKDGKEVYENDVVRFRVAEQGKEDQNYERIELVHFYCGSFRAGSGCLSEWSHENGLVAGKLKNRHYVGFGQKDIYMIDFDIEVIGNRFQHPHLLNK
jgi:uncharacterized phage protein (TIGR01671 family)